MASAALIALARRADELARAAVPDRGIAVGSENERLMHRSEALSSVVRAAQMGWDLDHIARTVKASIRLTVGRHNARRPTDPNWGVDPGAYDALIDEAVASLGSGYA